MHDVVDDYLRFHAPIALAERNFYASLPIGEAIERAARAERPDGLRHEHQRRIRRSAMRKVQTAFRGLHFQKGVRFGDLYAQIAASTVTIKGIGPLFVYDAALRISAKLGCAPSLVYIHAGVRKGARAVLRGGISAAEPPSRFPPPLAGRSAWELEDILCIFGKALMRIKRDHDRTIANKDAEGVPLPRGTGHRSPRRKRK